MKALVSHGAWMNAEITETTGCTPEAPTIGPEALDYKIAADLSVELNLFGTVITATGDRRESLIALLESFLGEYEAKALNLDLQEGNYG